MALSQGHRPLAPGGMQHIEPENSAGVRITNNVTAIGSPSLDASDSWLASKPAG